jgi:hypothetical protein
LKEAIVNLFEIIWLLAIIFWVYHCAKWFGIYFGVFGWVIGFVVGIVSALIAWVILDKLVSLWAKLRPHLPKCRKCNCSSIDYKLLKCSQDSAIWQCRCGTKYARIAKKILNPMVEQHFMEILDDGTTKPYMKRKGAFRRLEQE